MENTNENENIKNAIKQKEIALLRKLKEIEESTNESIIKLKKQDEQIDRLHQSIDTTNDKLKFSESVLNKMKSMFYFLRSKPEQVLDEDKDDNISGSSKTGNNEKNKYKSKINQNDKNEQSDVEKIDNIDMILHNVNVIKNNTQKQNEVLNNQNKKMDNIYDDTDNAASKLHKLNKKIKKI
jgi:hypothetical protein